MAKGWVKLHRQIMNHPFYEEERVFSRYEAWSHLMMMANHTDNKTLIDGKMVIVERGSFLTSVRKLQERWKWSNTKTIKFLDLLEKEKMIVKKSDTKKTLITLTTYEIYQGEGEEKRHENDTETTQKRTNKNVKNVENEKNIKKEPKKEYVDYVFLTEPEYDKLTDILGEKERELYFLRFASWISGQPPRVQKNRSAYLTILNWCKDSGKKSNVTPLKRESYEDHIMKLNREKANQNEYSSNF